MSGWPPWPPTWPARAAGRGPDLEIAAWCQSLLSALTQGETLADDVALACIELRGLP